MVMSVVFVWHASCMKLKQRQDVLPFPVTSPVYLPAPESDGECGCGESTMDTRQIDEAIDKYVNERMKASRKSAADRFLSYAYLKYAGDELGDFMRKVRGLSRYYIDFLKVMENPFKGPELAWFASMITVGVVSCYMMGDEGSRLAGIFIFSGTLVHAWALLRMVAKKWRDIGVMIAIYREIIDIIDKESTAAA